MLALCNVEVTLYITFMYW